MCKKIFFNVLVEPIRKRESKRVKVAQKCGKTDFFSCKNLLYVCAFPFVFPQFMPENQYDSNQLHNNFNVIIIGFEYLFSN